MTRQPAAKEKIEVRKRIEEFYNKTKATRPPEIGIMKDQPLKGTWMEVGQNDEYNPSDEAYKARTIMHTHLAKEPETQFFSEKDLEGIITQIRKMKKDGGKKTPAFPQKTIDAVSIVHYSKNRAKEAGRIIIRVPDKLKKAIAEKKDDLGPLLENVLAIKESRQKFLADKKTRQEHAQLLKQIAENSGVAMNEKPGVIDTTIEEASLFKALLEKHGFQTRFQPMPGFEYDQETMTFRPKRKS